MRVNAENRLLLRRAGGFELVSAANTVVDVGLNILAQLVADVPYGLTHLALGTGTTPPAQGNTQLEVEEYRAQFTRRVVAGSTCELELYIPQSEGNGFTYTEAGLLRIGRRDSAVGDPADLFSRLIISPGVVKDATVELSLIWQLVFSEVI